MKLPQAKHPTLMTHQSTLEYHLQLLHLWCRQKMFCAHHFSLHLGKVSILTVQETELVWFIFEFREQVIQVTTRMVRKFAENIQPEFEQKQRGTRSQAV